MGLFSNLFGKQTCVLCNAECGPLKRDKLKSGEFICSDCRDKCSQYIRVSEYTLDELKEHMNYAAYMKRFNDEIFTKPEYGKEQYPSSVTQMGVQFCDDLGMLKILNHHASTNAIDEIVRYDQIAGYDDFEVTEEAEGKEPEFKEAGITLRFIQPRDTNKDNELRGLRCHPYLKRELKIVFAKNKTEKTKAADARLAKEKLNRIFGVYDGDKSLLGFGMSKAEKRDLMGKVGMIKAMGSIANAAVRGDGELSEEQQDKLRESFNAVDDVNTGGLSVYSRRADEAEAKLQ